MKNKFRLLLAIPVLVFVTLSCSAEKNDEVLYEKLNKQGIVTDSDSLDNKEENVEKVEEPVIISSNNANTPDEPKSEKKDVRLKAKKPEQLPTVSIQKMVFPLPDEYKNYVSSPQGLRDSILNVNSGGGATLSTYHNALDIACPDKTPVYAAKNGYIKTVYPSYYNGGAAYKGHPQYGGLVEILHPDGTTTLYAHLSFTEVLEGTYVEAGQEIGWSGGVKGRRGSGNSTGAHLHFAVYISIEDMFMF